MTLPAVVSEDAARHAIGASTGRSYPVSLGRLASATPAPTGVPRANREAALAGPPVVRERPSRYAPGAPPEADLWNLWESAVRRGVAVEADGERLRIVSPGRRGRGPGPDFRDAVARTSGGRLVVGDVEVHRHPSGWREHGHHRDPRYNNVMLHVVFRGGGAAQLELGITAPTVALEGRGAEAASVDAIGGYPCGDALLRLGRERVEEALKRAGDARFREKARRFRLRTAHALEEEVLYGGLMDALGYSANREPFRRLALMLPYSWLRRRALALPGRTRAQWLSDVLMAASGLSEASAAAGCVPPVLRASDWRLGGLRPANHPRPRLLGAALLLHRWLPTGLVSGLEALVRAGSGGGLLEALTVKGAAGGTLVGRGRALDMTVNVMLPFFYSLALRRRDRPLARAAQDAYAVLPRGEENELTREFRSRALADAGPIRAGAREQQGMIHVYRRGCRWLACGACPLGGGAPLAAGPSAAEPRQGSD